MTSRLRRLRDRVVRFVYVISQATRTLAALLTVLTISGLFSAIAGYLTNVLPLLVEGVVVFILGVLLAILLYTFVLETTLRRFPTDVPIYPERPLAPQPDFEVLLKDITYQYYEDGQKMRQTKHFRVRALRDGVASFPDRYVWTGTPGRCMVRSLTPGYEVVNKRKEEFWTYFDVQFPHPLKSGDQADFVVEWDLYDEKRTAVPFLSTMIDFPTQHLRMRVVLPENLRPKEAFAYDFRNYIDKLPVAVEEKAWDPATHSISYEVPNPQYPHKYLLRWYW